MHFLCILLVRPNLIRVKFVARILRLHLVTLRQGQVRAIYRHANHRAIFRGMLKYGDNLTTVGDHATDPPAAFGGQIAKLDTAFAEHSNSATIGGVFRFRPKFDSLARSADGCFEQAVRAAFIGVGYADDG